MGSIQMGIVPCDLDDRLLLTESTWRILLDKFLVVVASFDIVAVVLSEIFLWEVLF